MLGAPIFRLGTRRRNWRACFTIACTAKLMKLADSVLVYPAHGAGSLCGKNMRAERSSTIGTERLTNYALQIKSRKDFVAQLTSNLPARPEYFLKDAEINRTGAAALADLPPLRGHRAICVECHAECWANLPSTCVPAKSLL